MKTLAGILCVRNGFRLDYCWELCGQSLLEFCDELVLCDCDSDDGTKEAMEKWELKEPRINLVNFPWTDPKGDPSWWPTWQNYARQHCTSDWCIFTDADEILHEKYYQTVRHAAEHEQTLTCQRLNFWRDTQSLIPIGQCLSHRVIRVGSSKRFMPSDYPDPRGQETMDLEQESEATFYHYGFLRKREAFFKKAREVQRIWMNDFDPRLKSAEDDPGPWMENHKVSEWVKDLVPFTGNHPEIIKPWLIERGYDVR